jgi:hypothetical protein
MHVHIIHVRHISAYGQVSDQAVHLWQEGWFQNGAEPSGVSVLRNPKVTLSGSSVDSPSLGLEFRVHNTT